MRIAELAKLTGVTTSAIRYYESRGLIQPSARTESGYRLFEPRTVGRVGFIQRAKALGLSLTEIEQLLQERREPSDQQRIRHAVAHKLVDTERRIQELEMLRTELNAMHKRLSTVDATCGRIGDCECWLPNDKEAQFMSHNADGCDCCGCTCTPGEGGCCSCCGCNKK
jgi:MerR family Zn(II)-responsive transcriptional regulator of zntA